MEIACACGCGTVFESVNARGRSRRFVCGHNKRLFATFERKSTPKAVRTPTMLDIAWAAGIYEGEGSIAASSSVTVTQKDPYLLRKLQDLFGGAIYSNTNRRGAHAWCVSGTRARGFIYTIFTFLSPRRRRQVRDAYGVREEQRKQKLMIQSALKRKVRREAKRAGRNEISVA
jgi:hypothetical protein